MMRGALALLVLLMVIAGPAWAEVQGKPVDYKHGDTVLEGYLAYDDSYDDKRPAVIVVHEWKGLGPYAQRRAEQLAELGYVGFAIDMYGKGVRAQDHKNAAQLAGIYKEDRALMRERARAGLTFLREQPMVDTERIAAIGFCFGGTTVLEMARAGDKLRAVVSLHGGLGTPWPAHPGTVWPKILVLHGADDKFVPSDEVEAFQEEMRKAKADWTFVALGGAVHSFTVPEAGDDPSKGMAYNARAERRSWQMMTNLLQEAFE